MESSWLYLRVGDVGWLQDFIFLFLALINGRKEQDGFKIILRGLPDKIIACIKTMYYNPETFVLSPDEATDSFFTTAGIHKVIHLHRASSL